MSSPDSILSRLLHALGLISLLSFRKATNARLPNVKRLQVSVRVPQQPLSIILKGRLSRNWLLRHRWWVRHP